MISSVSTCTALLGSINSSAGTLLGGLGILTLYSSLSAFDVLRTHLSPLQRPHAMEAIELDQQRVGVLVHVRNHLGLQQILGRRVR